MSAMPLVLVPCKSLAYGKSRLAELLDAGERERLCRELLINTLRLAADTAGQENVCLLTADAEAGRIAQDAGIQIFAKDWPDLNTAIAGARDDIIALSRWQSCLVLPIDLPLATKTSLLSIIANGADVTIVPDRGEAGTNILMLRGKALPEWRFAYGEASFEAHCREARQRGLSLDIRRVRELAFDIDEPDDYLEWKKHRELPREKAQGDSR